MKTLLVTGASGFLGWNVCSHLQPGWRLVGTYFQNSTGIPPKTENLKLDLTDKDSIWRALKLVKPDAVFHLAAFSNTNFCEKHPEETQALNVTASAHLAEMCADRKVRLLFTSSEQVYDGLKASYGENDLPSPRNEYGKQKLEAEERLAEIYPAAAIARIAVLYGKSGEVSKSFLQQWLESWQTFLPVTAFHDEIRSFLSARSAVEGLFKLLEQDACGVFNLAGEAPLSRYEFALLAKEIFNLTTGSVIAKSQQEVEMAAYRPPNLTLDTRKISSTGFQPRHPAGELKDLAGEIILPPGFSEN
jgi:dTDP-4-dehydrorhamnose reductase